MSCLILNNQAGGDFFEPDAQDATNDAPYAFLFLWEARD